MKASVLKQGGTIGICSPSHVAVREKYNVLLSGIKALGFCVKEAPNLYKNTYGYLASPEERAADLNALVLDPGVDMILFGGGEASNELLPLIDFDAIRLHPKRFLSYSDGTTILGAIWQQTGIVTYYGLMPGAFDGLTTYNRENFFNHIMSDADKHLSSGKWKICNKGCAEGILVGGYLLNFALLMNTPFSPANIGNGFILFLEDHEKFGNVAHVSALISAIEQTGFMKNVRGLLFGHYSVNEYPELLARLERLGENYQIPVAYCDDYGHGENHAVLDIGRKCKLDTEKGCLRYLD